MEIEGVRLLAGNVSCYCLIGIPRMLRVAVQPVLCANAKFFLFFFDWTICIELYARNIIC
jgi:hypothetical protein